jgi:NAD+ diphosphatase
MGDRPVFVADLSALDEAGLDRIVGGLDPESRFHDLRLFGPHLLGPDAAIHAYARGICYWHRHNRFCSRCGQAQLILHGGHMRKCNGPECGRAAFPHINPAVIMAVALHNPGDGIPKCLLGRHSGLPTGMYSTLAGFVDIGESLEEAVAREVMEEAGVAVSRAWYAGSQPWPFPSSLMIGFRAETGQEELNVDYDELEDARWFSVDDLKSFGEYDGSENMALPRKDSIARNLIESWIADNSDDSSTAIK